MVCPKELGRLETFLEDTTRVPKGRKRLTKIMGRSAIPLLGDLTMKMQSKIEKSGPDPF